MACKCCETDDCCCTEDADNYTVTFSGLTNGTKTGCTLLNGQTFCMCAGVCRFQSPADNTSSGATDYFNFLMRLIYDCDASPQVVRLEVRTLDLSNPSDPLPIIATYEKARSSWTCGASNTLDFVSAEDGCDDWPSTVTLTPNGDHDVCCECDDCLCTSWSETDINDPSKIVQRAWEVTFTGITDAGDCPSCVELNDTFCMTTFSSLGECEWQEGGTGSLPVHSWPPGYPDRQGPYHVCTGCEWRSCYTVPVLCGWGLDDETPPANVNFIALLKTGCEEVILPPTNLITYHPCVFRVPACHYYLRFGAHRINDDPPPDQPATEGGIVNYPIYVIPLDDFDPSGTNVLTRLDPETYGLDLNGTDTCPSGYVCDGWPSTVTISPVDECEDCEGIPPPESCACLPKSSYAPRILISGIASDSCDDCECLGTLDLCFDATGSASECTWRADFTLPTSAAISCTTNATYALLSTGTVANPDDVVLGIYDSGNTLLAQFSGALSGFDCDDDAFALTFDSQTDSECDWSGATATLDMHGDACETCVCDPGLWLFSVEYASNEYTWCVSVGECSGDSGIYEIFSGGGAGLSVTVELGELPASFARVLVYYYPDADVPGTRTLIGVYNYLSDMTSFTCSTSSGNVLHLATGNAGQCGADVDETETADLDSTASLSATTTSASCPTCDGDPMPPGLTATFANNSGNCCDNALATTLVWDSVNQWWYGEITGCSSGETIQITLEQTGTSCSSFRMTVAYVNSCDPGVSNQAPEGGCSCGSLTFNVTGDVGTISDDFITVTW